MDDAGKAKGRLEEEIVRFSIHYGRPVWVASCI
jgi:hypothetical protein